MNDDSRKVVLFGGGTQAKYAAETFQLQDIEVVAVIDRNPTPTITWPETYGIPVLGSDEGLADAKKLGATHALICTADPRQKEL